jgi:hypothetical protein
VLVSLSIMAGPGEAQQPGTVEYNTVFLPANGLGDTRRAGPVNRYGAVALGRKGAIGFAAVPGSERTAEAAAV